MVTSRVPRRSPGRARSGKKLKGQSITSRYIHSADAVLLAAADTVANWAAELMGVAKSGVVVPLRQAAQ